jgi:hypothetical protein
MSLQSLRVSVDSQAAHRDYVRIIAAHGGRHIDRDPTGVFLRRPLANVAAVGSHIASSWPA